MWGRRSEKEVHCDGEKLEEYFGNLQENLSGFDRQAGECKQKGLKPVYNPAVCTEGIHTNHLQIVNASMRKIIARSAMERLTFTPLHI